MSLAALWRLIRPWRRKASEPAAVDPRADELRARLDESRAVVDDREEFEAGETPVDAAEPVPADPDERRRSVHAEGRSAVDRMRGSKD